MESRLALTCQAPAHVSLTMTSAAGTQDVSINGPVLRDLGGAGRDPPLVREVKFADFTPPAAEPLARFSGAGRDPPLAPEVNSRTSPHLRPSPWLGLPRTVQLMDSS